jgi:hypothetical protein
MVLRIEPEVFCDWLVLSTLAAVVAAGVTATDETAGADVDATTEALLLVVVVTLVDSL